MGQNFSSQWNLFDWKEMFVTTKERFFSSIGLCFHGKSSPPIWKCSILSREIRVVATSSYLSKWRKSLVERWQWQIITGLHTRNKQHCFTSMYWCSTIQLNLLNIYPKEKNVVVRHVLIVVFYSLVWFLKSHF